MKKKRFSVEQIAGVLKQAEVGVPVAELVRRVRVAPRIVRVGYPLHSGTPYQPVVEVAL